MQKNTPILRTKHVMLTILLILALSLTLAAKPLTLNEAMEGSCRVSVTNGIGSGTCIKKDGQHYIFLTNGHVVENHKTASVELFRDGYKSYKIPATVVKTFWQEHTDKDFALVAVHEQYVSQYPPRVIPLIPMGYDVQTGYMYSAGCPEGRWLSGWEGHIEEKQPTRLIFTPPPVGGQSGSSLLVNIQDTNGELHTRVGAVITFRMGDSGVFSDRRDKDGFELAKGVAIPISTLYKLLNYNTLYQPTKFSQNYIETQSKKICTFCQRVHTKDPLDYAIDINNVGHCVRIENGKMVCRGKNIIKWPHPDRIIPIPNRPKSNQPNNGNPYGNNLPDISPPELPPKAEIVPDTTLKDDETKQLQQQIQDLQDKIANLEIQLSTANNNRNIDSTTIEAQTEEKNKLTEEKNKLTNDITTLNSNLDTISDTLTVAEKDKTVLEKQMVETTEEHNKAQKQRTWLGWLSGGLGGGLLWLLGWMGWNKIGRSKAKQVVDSTQDTIDDYIDDYIGKEATRQLHSTVDELQDTISNAIDNAIKSKLPTIVKNRVEKKTDNQETQKTQENLKEKEVKKEVDKSGGTQYNRKERRKNKSFAKTPKPINLNITNTNTNTQHDYDDSYIKEFFHHKAHDGENVEDWAFRSVLYKEAIDELTKGKLYYKGTSRLQGQQKTAQQINEWVRAEFLKRITRREVFNQDELYREAMLGFLYKEAVDKLANGYFTVLGYQATATAVNNWVNAEFLKRIKVNI